MGIEETKIIYSRIEPLIKSYFGEFLVSFEAPGKEPEYGILADFAGLDHADYEKLHDLVGEKFNVRDASDIKFNSESYEQSGARAMLEINLVYSGSNRGKCVIAIRATASKDEVEEAVSKLALIGESIDNLGLRTEADKGRSR